MHKTFPEYFYEPNIKKLWKQAIFVPDTNVLLDIYCYPPETSRALVKILKYLKDQDRLWIPYQFVHEYLKNLPTIRLRIREDFKQNKKSLNSRSNGILDLLKKYNDETDYDLDKHIGEIKDIFQTIKNGLQESRQKHANRLKHDDLQGNIQELLGGIIGPQFSEERLIEVYDEGVRRYRLRQPPGFKDAGKDESRRYGDLIGWLQIICYVNRLEKKRPIIMVTNDSSGNDWFFKPGLDGKTQGPRPELVKEMREKANVNFYIYQTSAFMELANRHLELDEPVPETAIEEARSRDRRATQSSELVAGVRKSNLARFLIDDQLRQINAAIKAQTDAALQPIQATTAAAIDAMTRPAVEAVNAYVAEIATQAFKNLSYDAGLLYRSGTSRRRASTRDDIDERDKETDGDNETDDDPNDDDPNPTPELA